MWSSSSQRISRPAPFCGGGVIGYTLIELLVTLAILSILAVAAVPYAELTVQRTKELELRRVLRDVRQAIDQFHSDWSTGKISKTNADASEDGYPRTLTALVDGVESAQAKGGKRRYLRRIPRDPFVRDDTPAADHWSLRGYQDEPDTSSWNGKDVYDIRSLSDGMALDGTRYKEW